MTTIDRATSPGGTRAVSTPRAPAPAGLYSQGIIARGFLFTAGFGPHDPQTGAVPDGIESQTRAVFANLGAVLAEADAGFGDVVKITAHLQHLKRDFAGFNGVFAEVLTPPYPVRTTVGSELWDILVEIDVVVALR